MGDATDAAEARWDVRLVAREVVDAAQGVYVEDARLRDAIGALARAIERMEEAENRILTAIFAPVAEDDDEQR